VRPTPDADALNPPAPRTLTSVARALLFLGGTVSLGLGIVGAFVPGLPTTVFLLIAIACYIRSSERMYRWVLTRKWLARPVARALEFQRTRSIPLGVKITAMGFAWGSVALTWLGAGVGWALGFVALMALVCTAVMILVKTDRPAAPHD
jgi:uncharacterized membrane protein YbaN (DUF454 family)